MHFVLETPSIEYLHYLLYKINISKIFDLHEGANQNFLGGQRGRTIFMQRGDQKKNGDWPSQTDSPHHGKK